jgi:hypothetical protein
VRLVGGGIIQTASSESAQINTFAARQPTADYRVTRSTNSGTRRQQISDRSSKGISIAGECCHIANSFSALAVSTKGGALVRRTQLDSVVIRALQHSSGVPRVISAPPVPPSCSCLCSHHPLIPARLVADCARLSLRVVWPRPAPAVSKHANYLGVPRAALSNHIADRPVRAYMAVNHSKPTKLGSNEFWPLPPALPAVDVHLPSACGRARHCRLRKKRGGKLSRGSREVV